MSYEEVVKQTPVATAKFVNYADGEKIGLTNEGQVSGGTISGSYLKCYRVFRSMAARWSSCVLSVIRGVNPCPGKRESIFAEKKTTGDFLE